MSPVSVTSVRAVEILLVRHALPMRIDVAPGGGPADPGLAPRGIEQAERVAAALQHDSVDALYTSPKLRAVQTAAPLVTALGMDPVVEAGIREFDSDDPSYVPVEELKASGDPRWHRLVAGDLYTAGVDPVAFRASVVEAVERIAARHAGGRAVLVSHSGAINAYAGHVLGQDRPLFFAPSYCSITRIAIARSGRTGVVSLNETGHVRDLL
ncbi:MAG: histidine phosphatase family protein [Mycobacteriales bacterium]